MCQFKKNIWYRHIQIFYTTSPVVHNICVRHWATSWQVGYVTPML